MDADLAGELIEPHLAARDLGAEILCCHTRSLSV